MTDYRIEQMFTLRSPLSHIGETISATSYLVQEHILQPDNTVEEVFCYSGNAWRGQLRDICAAYMLDKLGSVRLPLNAFHLLFSGGRIGGAQSVDIDQARRIRAAVPMMALFGGGVGNQILQGKMRVGGAYPLCREAIPVLPAELHDAAEDLPYASCTFTKQHSRRDDSKIENVRRHLDVEEPMQALLLAGGSTTKAVKPAKASKKDDGGAADQQRIGMELVTSGVKLWSWITLENVSAVELGCLVAGLHAFSKHPLLGGKSSIGYGSVDYASSIMSQDDGEVKEFVKIEGGRSLLAPVAEAAKDAYDQHLRLIFDAHIAQNANGITALLGAN
jgi:CRISPR type IV-associated protein Csf2